MTIFGFPLPYLVHMFLMTAAFLLFIPGWYLARFKRKRTWWLKGHRILNTWGLILAVLAFSVIFGFKIYLGSEHFSGVHSITGGTALIFFALTPLLSTVLKKKKHFYRLHPWFGRFSLLTASGAVTLGFLNVYGII